MPSPQPRALTKKQISDCFARLQKANPNPETELYFINDFTLLVAVVLSAQATDKGVNKATPALFAAADTPEKMAKLGEAKIRAHIKTIGLYRNKAKNVFLLSKQLLAEHKGKVPRTREALMSLAGVGRKTANVVMNVAFGDETFAVDTHVFRLANRIGLTQAEEGKNVQGVEAALEKRVPPPFRRNAHHWLILHGRAVCNARAPKCDICPINDICRHNKTQKRSRKK